MAADVKAVFLEVLKKICPLCGSALERHPAMQVFFAVITPLVLFLCMVFVVLSPLSGPLSMLLIIAFSASTLIALQTIYAKIIRPVLHERSDSQRGKGNGKLAEYRANARSRQ